MYKSLFSTGSLLFELLNGLPVPLRPTALCGFFFLLFLLLLLLLASASPPFPPSTTRAKAVPTQPPVPVLRSEAALAALNAFRDGRHPITSLVSWPAF